ncbi:hypothetical protein Bca52824_050080 [Brassica carinata]|uniref:Uncharacterized protein n=1 Tax=Brassica carinata TaxID=52824 RepID=A0A8X7UUR4_BRACI|nr:hypothetical protein Bca52824_050080 [Brassica carinata]
MSPPKTELSLGLLGVSSDFSDYCPGPSPSSADTEIKPDLQNLIHDLILHIHEKEPDIEKSILVFLPTYYSLEQQCFWSMLTTTFVERAARPFLVAGGRWYSWRHYVLFSFGSVFFKDKHRVESLKQLLSKEKDKDVKLMLPVIEQDWCDFHNISRSSFYHVSEMFNKTTSSSSETLFCGGDIRQLGTQESSGVSVILTKSRRGE